MVNELLVHSFMQAISFYSSASFVVVGATIVVIGNAKAANLACRRFGRACYFRDLLLVGLDNGRCPCCEFVWSRSKCFKKA